MPAACDKRGSNTLFAGPRFISSSSIFPVGHHTTRRLLVRCGRLRRQGHSRELSPQKLSPHALHVLDKTAYIYVMDGEVIIEQGIYKVIQVLLFVDAALTVCGASQRTALFFRCVDVAV